MNHWSPSQTPAAQKSTFKAQTGYSDIYLLKQKNVSILFVW